jgi:hypothetical protein
VCKAGLAQLIKDLVYSSGRTWQLRQPLVGHVGYIFQKDDACMDAGGKADGVAIQ